MIYLDNAATTGKKPQIVINSVVSALQNMSANPGRSGHKSSQAVGEFIYKTRKKVANFFGCKSTDVVFTQNCTQSLNYVIKGVLKKGDHLIISSLEHNAVARPAYKMFCDGDIELDVAQVVLGDKDATLRSFTGLIKNNTKMIVCTHASNVTGEIMPIIELSKLCKEYGIIFAVDAAQTAGVLPMNMKEIGIDYLCVASHKGLYSPMGTGILCASRPIENTIIEGGTGSFSNMLIQPQDMPDKLESGTINVPGIAGIGAGIDFVNKKGIDSIFKQEINLIKELFLLLKQQKNVTIYSQNLSENTVPVLSFNVQGFSSMETADFLSKNGIAVRAGLHCSPLAHLTLGTIDVGCVRVSTSVFNSTNDIYALIRAVRKLKK